MAFALSVRSCLWTTTASAASVSCCAVDIRPRGRGAHASRGRPRRACQGSSASRTVRCVTTETCYTRNGDLSIAYRTIGKGSRDIVVVSNWFTNCDVLPELPPFRDWIDAMTALGRLVFFDQPGAGAVRSGHDGLTSNASSNGPTASPQSSTISRPQRPSSSRSTAPSRPAHCSPPPIRLVRRHWSCLRAAPPRLPRPRGRTHAGYSRPSGTRRAATHPQPGDAVERGSFEQCSPT